MENNLINTAQSFFTEETISTLSDKTGENSEQVKSSMDTIIPTMFLGLQSQSKSGLTGIFDQLKGHFADFDFSNIGNLTDLFGKNSNTNQSSFSSNILSSIFGNSSKDIITTITEFVGIKPESVQTLLSAGLPAVLSSLTDKGKNLNIDSIWSSLSNGKADFVAALPAGLGLSSFGSAFAVDSEVVVNPVKDVIEYDRVITPAPEAPAPEPVKAAPIKTQTETPKKGAGLWWLLIPLIALLVWFFFGKSCGKEKETPATTTDTEVVTTTGNVNEFVDIALPNGTILNGNESGIEQSLIAFLESGVYKTMTDEELKSKWFDFDRLNFETGTATLTPDSQSQLENLAAILKAFPDAKLKVGGYTDKTGTEEQNKVLSQQRADVIKSDLTDKGIGSQIIGAEGYGSEFAVYPADAPESDRIKDRRVGISIRK